jgi:hypothetical protein
MKRYILLLIAAAFSLSVVEAAEPVKRAESDTLATKSRFLPTRQRIDRNIDLTKFVYKGEFMVGLNASYGNIKAVDSDIMLLLDNINVGLRSTTIRPFLAYSFKDNQAVGIRFGYQNLRGEIGSLDLNLGLIADIENMGLSNMGLVNESFTWSIFHRNYIGLDRRGIFGIILESELLFKSGTTSMWSGEGDERTKTDSRNFAVRFNYNPGIAIYVFPQVCFTVTVGIGGLYYNNIRQFDMTGVEVGRRDRTGLQFKLNIADIQIGLVAHLWNNKKK